MKKLVAQLTSICLLLSVSLSGCAYLPQKSTEVFFNGAMITTAALTIYSQYNDVSKSILTKFPKMEEADAKTLSDIAARFNAIKESFENLTDNATNVYKVTLKLTQYRQVYATMQEDYTIFKTILIKYSGLFSNEEWRDIRRFDTEVRILNNQVLLIEQAVIASANSSNVDITAILERTLLILKTISALAVMI